MVIVACDLACTWLLMRGYGLAAPLLWLACALVSGFICVIDSYGLLGPGAAIGGIPASLIALAPAALPAALGLPNSPEKTLCWVIWAFSSLLAAFFGLWFTRLRSAYAHAAPIEPNAVLVVLGGYIIDGVPCLTVQRRLEVAARLWHESPQRIMLLTGGPTPDGSTTEAEAMATWAGNQLGIPQHALVLETNASNTEENLSLAKALLAEKGLGDRQVCIVSSDYHLFRAQAIARKLGIDATSAASSVPITSRLQQWCREVLTLCVKGVG